MKPNVVIHNEKRGLYIFAMNAKKIEHGGDFMYRGKRVENEIVYENCDGDTISFVDYYGHEITPFDEMERFSFINPKLTVIVVKEFYDRLINEVNKTVFTFEKNKLDDPKVNDVYAVEIVHDNVFDKDEIISIIKE